MQRTLTWTLTALAIGLFALIYFFERKIPGTADRLAAPRLLPRVNPSDVRALEITFAGGAVVRAEQTNGVWFLTRPFYPAKQNAIERFITNLVSLRRFDEIPQHRVVMEGQKAFGLEPPLATVLVSTETNRFLVEVGGPAPLTNNIYLRLEPSPDVVLAQADLLQSLPRTTNDWRSQNLLHLSQRGLTFDHLQVRAGQRIFELGKNLTNNLWQITRPIPARGNQFAVATLFEHLSKAQVSSFVADGPVDLERYGLQTPALELDLNHGTNTVFSVEFGGSVTNLPGDVYARLPGTSNIVTVSQNLLSFLQQPYKAFHDTQLLTLDTNIVDRITADSLEKFSIVRQPRGRWLCEGDEPVAVDSGLLGDFVQTILSMRILDIVKEVPSDADLQALGLREPRVAYSFYQKSTNSAGAATNLLLCQLSFGTNLTDRIYARRSDETPVYLTELAPLLELPHQAFRLRERRIWNFSTNDVVRISLAGPSATNSAARSGAGWGSDPLASAAIEESLFRMSRLQVIRWVAKGEEVKRQMGITPESLRLEIELKLPAGPKVLQVYFGKPAPQHNVYASSPDISDEPLIFEFPGEVYHLLLQNLPAAR